MLEQDDVLGSNILFFRKTRGMFFDVGRNIFQISKLLEKNVALGSNISKFSNYLGFLILGASLPKIFKN